MAKFEERELSRKDPQEQPSHYHQAQPGSHFFIGGVGAADQENDQKNGRVANTLFHDQLREKHSYLEDSIRSQQMQLQMLQQKLMTLANHGAGIYPMQMQLQSPLNKVMELQNWVGRHREETLQQRQLIDGRPPNLPPAHPG